MAQVFVLSTPASAVGGVLFTVTRTTSVAVQPFVAFVFVSSTFLFVDRL